MTLEVAKIELGVKLTVPKNALQTHLPAPIDNLGEQLAVEVHRRVKQKKLGYFPALDYFLDDNGFPGYLINAVDDVCALSVEIVTTKISDVLVPIFSSVQVNDIRCASFSMPTVRFGEPDAIAKLSHHFTPNIIKFSLVVTLLQTQTPQADLSKYANNTVYRWLEETFEDIEIGFARLL